jgi:RNA polymerase sigma factor (sigma-70 family)
MKGAARTRTESDARRSALMVAVQAGDRVAYETLLRDCVSFIVGLARRQGVPADRVDDVVQDVLLTVHRARAAYDPRRSFEAWLHIIVERRAIDVLRQIFPQNSIEETGPTGGRARGRRPSPRFHQQGTHRQQRGAHALIQPGPQPQ